MRDPKRINKILNKIKKIGMLDPDGRTGQMLSCVFGEHIDAGGHKEDDFVEEYLEKYYQAHKPDYLEQYKIIVKLFNGRVPKIMKKKYAKGYKLGLKEGNKDND